MNCMLGALSELNQPLSALTQIHLSSISNCTVEPKDEIYVIASQVVRNYINWNKVLAFLNLPVPISTKKLIVLREPKLEKRESEQKDFFHMTVFFVGRNQL